MLHRVFFVCLFLALCSAASSLSCNWMDHKFRQFSKNSLDLIDTMANNSTSTTGGAEEDDTVTFPSDLYSQARASAEDKLGFTVQVLEEVVRLFEADHSSASWQESTVENFLNIVTRQAEGLRSCIGAHIHTKKNKKLHMYFKRLSHHVLENKASFSIDLSNDNTHIHLVIIIGLIIEHQINSSLQGHSAEAWELIRKEIKTHLLRTDQLVSSLLTTN
ncbi:Interferon a3 [Channa argus]|uniref:Interferon a3 n=1 Tax=Channa argus TaxID=215402 RepID=A0A6G1QP84_CHAAH|nr:Interferon a3 [Channa argus]